MASGRKSAVAFRSAAALTCIDLRRGRSRTSAILAHVSAMSCKSGASERSALKDVFDGLPQSTQGVRMRGTQLVFG